jgi:hypothetical protein
MTVIRRGLLLGAVLVLASCGGGGGSDGGGSSPPPGGSVSPFTVPNPFALAGATTVEQVRVDDLRVFGDSYSVENFAGATTTWSTVLDNNGTAADLENYAIGGARAAPGFSNAFDRQLDTWESANSPIGARDLTAVYFGYNDLVANDPGRESGYRDGIDRLVAAGAAGSDRKLFVTLLHDWSQNPSTGGVTRPAVQNWNSFVAGIANSNDNIIAVDLFTVFDRIYDDPAEFGFSNVTTVDTANSATTALYFDETHFGSRGQDVIARVYRHYLTRAWDWSNTLTAGGATASQLNQDITNGVLVLDLDAGQAGQQLGFNTFTFGGVKAAQGRALPFAEDAAAASVLEQAANRDPSRASFAEAYTTNPTTGGIALDYRPATNQRFGVAIARYDTTTDTTRPATQLVQDQSSDAVALYWQQAKAGFTATTQFSYLQHAYADRAHDEDVGLQGVNRYNGSTWALDQQIARPMRAAGSTVTPWVSVAYQSHDLEPYQAKSLYTSDVRYSGATATDVMGAIGLDLRPDAIGLGNGRHLWLSGGATYRTSLYRDDVEVSMSEAAIPGFSQTETVERERIERFDLSLDAVLGLDDDLALRAGYAFTTDRLDYDQLVRFSLDYRF